MYCLTLNYLKKLKIMQNNYNKKKYFNNNILNIINNNCNFSKLKKISDCKNI